MCCIFNRRTASEMRISDCGSVVCSSDLTLGLQQIMAGWAEPVVALIAIYAVHRLTQQRDKEKAVFELHKTIGESVGNTKTVILTAWEDPDATKRQAAIEQTKWRLQQLGGLVERLRKMSKRWRCQRAVIPLQISAVTLTADKIGRAHV